MEPLKQSEGVGAIFMPETLVHIWSHHTTCNHWEQHEGVGALITPEALFHINLHPYKDVAISHRKESKVASKGQESVMSQHVGFWCTPERRHTDCPGRHTSGEP